jgi:serine/threonine protein kinase
MKPERAYELITAVASGVGAAHRQNIVHRDLKPLNIMVQDDVPVAEGLKILDFGLAKIKSGELLGSFVQAQTSGLMGSPFYMAPEQWSDEEPDARADIYSLGVILYQMLAGEVPFKGSTIPSIMKKHLTLPPPSFQSMGASVPPQLEAVVRHALEKEVKDRIDSVESFLKEVNGAMSASPVVVTAARPTGSLDPNRTMISDEPRSRPTRGRPGFQRRYHLQSPAIPTSLRRSTRCLGRFMLREMPSKNFQTPRLNFCGKKKTAEQRKLKNNQRLNRRRRNSGSRKKIARGENVKCASRIASSKKNSSGWPSE